MATLNMWPITEIQQYRMSPSDLVPLGRRGLRSLPVGTPGCSKFASVVRWGGPVVGLVLFDSGSENRLTRHGHASPLQRPEPRRPRYTKVRDNPLQAPSHVTQAYHLRSAHQTNTILSPASKQRRGRYTKNTQPECNIHQYCSAAAGAMPLMVQVLKPSLNGMVHEAELHAGEMRAQPSSVEVCSTASRAVSEKKRRSGMAEDGTLEEGG